MKTLKYLWLFFLVLGFLSCKKEYPKPLVVENDAVFYSKLSVNNQPIELQAGVNGYYMYSSYSLDSNFVNTFVADLKQKDCSNCINSLKIQIKDYQVSLSNPPSNIDSALHKGSYPILSGNPAPTYSLQFLAANDNTASWHWDFGDGTGSEEQNPKHVFKTNGRHTICLSTTGNNGYQSTICNKENVNENALRALISTSNHNGNFIKFNSNVTGGKEPYQYFWNFGNGKTSKFLSDTLTYTYRGAYAVNLKVVDFYGDTAYANYNAKTINDISSSAANFTASATEKINPQPALSKVLITWTDANGIVYSSNNTSQPSQSFFEILSIAENEKNENNQPTKKLTAKFSCKLYNGTKSIEITNAEVVISVAY